MQEGTATKAQIGCPAAAKTGTTDEFTDAWLVGFTPRLATAVWVGYPTERVTMSTLYFVGPVDGGTFPAQIWGAYMKQAKGKFCGGFPPPKVPFHSQPFFGRYSRGAAKVKPDETTTPTTPAAPTETPTPDDKGGTGGAGAPNGNGNGNGKGNGNGPDKGFDPNMYESPPQPSPDATGDNGATQAPG